MADAKTERQKVKEITDKLEKGLKELFNSEKYKSYLSAMNDNDRLNIATYLESRGAWTTEIANQDTKEFGEYHLDVRYNTDTLDQL